MINFSFSLPSFNLSLYSQSYCKKQCIIVDSGIETVIKIWLGAKTAFAVTRLSLNGERSCDIDHNVVRLTAHTEIRPCTL